MCFSWAFYYPKRLLLLGSSIFSCLYISTHTFHELIFPFTIHLFSSCDFIDHPFLDLSFFWLRQYRCCLLVVGHPSSQHQPHVCLSHLQKLWLILKRQCPLFHILLWLKQHHFLLLSHLTPMGLYVTFAHASQNQIRKPVSTPMALNVIFFSHRRVISLMMW